MQREDVERLAHRLDRAMLYLPDGDTTAMGEEAAAALGALLARAEQAEAERDAAFAAGQEEMRERAAKAAEMAFHTGAGANDLLAAHNGGIIMAQNHIRALPIKDSPDGR